MKKVSGFEITEASNMILNIVEDKKSNVSNNLRKSFYFKGRKSNILAREIIEGFTGPKDIVLDPFFGGGSFILACLEANRYVEGTELDSYTFYAFATLMTKIDNEILGEYFDTVTNDVKDEVMYLYRTQCCGKENYIRKLLFDPEDEEYYNPIRNREFLDGKNIKLVNRCSICNGNSKKFDDYDALVLESTLELDNSNFPSDRFIENSRINITPSAGADKFDRNFSERNKQALLIVQEAISKLPKSKEKDFIQHALVTSLALAKTSMYGSSTDILYHVIREQGQEMNVWVLFESKYKYMLKFQEEYKNYLVDDVSDSNIMSLVNDSFRILKSSNKKYDMIYTDFPYTDQVPYLERNQLFRIWLEHFSDDKDNFKLTDSMLEEEVVLTNAPIRSSKNNIEQYFKDIDEIFAVFNHLLKEDKYLFLTMKLGENKYIRTYSEILNFARKNGFEYITRVSVEKKDPTLRKQSAYANTFTNEVIAIFKKLSEDKRYWYEGDLNYEYVATKLIYEDINKQDKRFISLTSAVALIRNDLLSKSIEPTIKRIILAEHAIRDHFNVDNNGDVFIDGNQLYLDIEDNTTLFIKLYDLIPLYIRKLLEEKGKFVLEDLYLELTASLIGGDSNILEQIINDDDYQNHISILIENYCDVSNGYYVKKKIENVEYSNSQDISQFDGYEFEALIKELLGREKYFDIITLGGAGDRGVDIVASILINKNVEKHIFQCKRWVSNVGSEPVQRLFAEQSYHSYDKAICITSSDFTSEGSNALERFDVEGWDGWKVQELLNKHFPGKYYNRILDSNTF